MALRAALHCATISAMKRSSDIGLALSIGSVLLGIAAYAVLGFQHGFEEQVAWYLALLPMAFPSAALSSLADRIIPGSNRQFFWTFFIVFNLLWYSAIALAFVKLRRFVSRALREARTH